MKICQDHWVQLKEAIKDRGLWELVSSNGQHLADRLNKELESGGPSPDTFDPLASAMFMIMTNALKVGGTYLMGNDEHGNEYCPLCELEKNRHLVGEGATDWINFAADDTITYAITHNLIPKVQ